MDLGGTNAASLQTQSRVLFTNLFVNVRRLPSSLAQAVLQALRPQTRRAKRVVDCVVSALCGVGQNLARQHFNAIRSNTWDPVRPEPQSVFIPIETMEPAVGAREEPVSEQAERNDTEVGQMMILIRESLAHAVRGLPDLEFARSVARLRLAGVPVGDKYTSRQFTNSI